MPNKIKYLPFMNGVYSTAPGLTLLESAAHERDRLFFQIDDTYSEYLSNKRTCRQEDIRKYYCEHESQTGTIQTVNRFMLHQLVKEYPEQFQLKTESDKHVIINRQNNEHIVFNPDWVTLENDRYLSLFDALCSQVQEDVAVVQLKDDKDWLMAIHLCSPNHWSPGEKVGKPFNEIHKPVPGIERTVRNYSPMLNMVIDKGPFTRFAWGIATDLRLNHHPLPPPGVDPDFWQGRQTREHEQRFYIRAERQNLVGFREVNAFLFTIRTYFYNVDTLQPEEKQALQAAVMSMTPETLQYKGLTTSREFLLNRLSR